MLNWKQRRNAIILKKHNMTGLILYGDSIFFGYGASNKNLGCGRLLKNRLSLPIMIKARNNVTTRDALAGLKDRVLADSYLDYSDVIVLIGNNDCRLVEEDTPVISLQEYKNNLIEIIKKINMGKKKCHICNLQPINDSIVMRVNEDIKKNMNQIKSPYSWHKQYSDTCEEVAHICKISVIDIRSPLEKSGKNIFFEDGMHPNDAGHELIANSLYSALVNKAGQCL